MSNIVDGSDYARLCENLEKASETLDRLSKEISIAKKLQKFAAGTEKGLVAKFVVKHMKAGVKPALAETLALADPAFIAERDQLMDAWETAQRVLDAHSQANTAWETARSLLSMAKAQLPSGWHQTRSQQG